MWAPTHAQLYTHTRTQMRIYCIIRRCVRVKKVHLLSDRPQQHNGCVGLRSVTDVWQADGLWHSHCCFLHTFTPLPSSSACLLISSGGGRKLPPFFFLNAVFPSPLSFPPLLLRSFHTRCCVFFFFLSFSFFFRRVRVWQAFRERSAEGRGIKQSPQLDGPHKRASELCTIFISCRIFHLSVADTFVPELKTHCSQQKAEEKPFSFEEQEAATSF